MARTIDRYGERTPVPDVLAGQCNILKHPRWLSQVDLIEYSTVEKIAAGLAGCSRPCKADTLQKMMQSIAVETMKSLGGRQGQ